jgi:hypothetical protein
MYGGNNHGTWYCSGASTLAIRCGHESYLEIPPFRCAQALSMLHTSQRELRLLATTFSDGDCV